MAFTCCHVAMSAIRRSNCALLLALAAACAGGSGGCASSFELKNPIPKQHDNSARLAAYEAAADYPQPQAGGPAGPAGPGGPGGAGGREVQTIAITAVIDRDGKIVRVVNPTETPYHGVRV